MNAPHPPAPAPAARLSEFRDVHHGGTIVVCGCGESLNLLERPGRFVTIGVNDVGRRFTPDYLVVVNSRAQFSADRFRHVEQSRARVLFTQLADIARLHPHAVQFRLGAYAGTDFSDPEVLPYTQNSPYVAVCLAVLMGARRIGMIGVDFTPNHFFACTGTHPLAHRLQQIEGEYARLADACRALDIDLVNLSPASRLRTLPKVDLDAFDRSVNPVPSAATKIVSYATTPVAGVPCVLARCIAARTPHAAHCVWATNDYGNGVRFDPALEWTRFPEEAEARLREADVVVVHNGKVDPRHAGLMEGKAIVVMAHNYLWNVDCRYLERGYPGAVVGQYQATLPEFSGWFVVPNPIPLWEPEHAPGHKADTVTICYTPSGRHEAYPRRHPLYWHGKGYDSTMRILERLARSHGIGLEVVRDGQVPHATALAMKRRAHIVIDECVTGSYHRNSLEGLASGCVVVNGVGLLAGVPEVLRQCAPDAPAVPFVHAGLGSLEAVLAQLIERGPAALEMQGRENRAWMERHWDFERQWRLFWEPVIASARAAAASATAPRQRGVANEREARRLAMPRNHRVHANEAENAQALQEIHAVRRPGRANVSMDGVSVVVPHGGRERLTHLRASLANLAQAGGVEEVIVAEMGAAPLAARIAHDHGARYVFVHGSGAFERGRALNAGSALARCDLVLWKDNDLLVPPGFVEAAAAESRKRGLDHLLPYHAIRYLSARDTAAVYSGAVDPQQCTPVKVLRGGRELSGGAALVRRAFLLRVGGIPEGFRGWGGEDNAWTHKARILGTSAVTRLTVQHLVHLHHADCGALNGAPLTGNPHYADNVALLKRLCSAGSAAEYLKRFPGTGRQVCPWPTTRRVVLLHAPDAGRAAVALAAGLRELYGIDIERVDVSAVGTLAYPGDSAQDLGALVVLGEELEKRIRTEERLAPFVTRMVVLDGMAGAREADGPGHLESEHPATASVMVPGTGLLRWPLTHSDPSGLAATVAQPLSLAMAAGDATVCDTWEAPLPALTQPGRPGPVDAASAAGMATATRPMPAPIQPQPVANVFACAVHERPECVVDLVRNLRYQDPDSIILLYDGSSNSDVLRDLVALERYGAVVCPLGKPLRWGYLHPFALQCMEFALRNFAFDTLTIVDSDQLMVRSGYSQHLARHLHGRSGVGLLGNAPYRQSATTRIAPAMQAWREVELWRPFLRRFPQGEDKFVHWTFWPSTVFTREGAQALHDLFTNDEQLASILARSRMWATEEILFPTLVALLGLRVEQNPCCYDFVRFRQSYSAQQVKAALERSDVFWLHPVPRHYDDEIRTLLRNRFSHYVRSSAQPSAESVGEGAMTPILLTTPILQQMRGIEGWLEDDEADLLIAAAARAVNELPAGNALVEIGSFCGKSTVVLGTVLRTLTSSSRLYAIDPHEGEVGAADQGIKRCAGTLEKLRGNLAGAGLHEHVEIIQKRSYEVEWDRPISLLFIDGLHDYVNVARDFHHFERWLVPGAYVAFHDYADYYPGVVAFVDELRLGGRYRLVHLQRSLALLQCLDRARADAGIPASRDE